MARNSLDSLFMSYGEEIRGLDTISESFNAFDMFVAQVFDLMEAVVRHLEGSEQESEIAEAAFRNHRRILRVPKSYSGEVDGTLEAVDRQLLFRLRESLNANRNKYENPVYREGLTGEGRGAWDAAGLTGVDLELKLTGWQRAVRKFLNEGTRKTLISAWRWANLLLGSAASAVPAFEALKELKDVFHNLYTDVTA